MGSSYILDQVRKQIGSNGKEGWPVAVRDRIHFPEPGDMRVTDSGVGVTFLWNERQSVVPYLEKDGLAIAANFYTPSGLQGMVRNILGNPFIRRVVMFGNEYSSRAGDYSEMTSANAIRAFFERGVGRDRKIEGFKGSIIFDRNIPLEEIERVRQEVQLIDLNSMMLGATLEEKINETNRIILDSERGEPFGEPQTFGYETMGGSFPYEGGPLIVRGRTIPEAWVKMVGAIDRFGVPNLMNVGTDRHVKEIHGMTVVVEDPQNEDLSLNPFLVPMTLEKIRAYQKEILSPELPEGKAYTYGNELRAYLVSNSGRLEGIVGDSGVDFEFGRGSHVLGNVTFDEKGGAVIDQVGDLIEVLRRDIYSKAAVAITWHPEKELMRKHKSSPCLTYLQPLFQDDRLNLSVLFRSHDMVQGWPENAYGMAAIQREIAEGVGVEPGLLKVVSESAQIYNNYALQVREMLEKNRGFVGHCFDSRGNFLIGTEGGEIVAKLTHPETGVELEVYRGRTAQEVGDKIASRTDLQTPHAIYLGREFYRAEKAIKEGKKYEQG